MRQNILNSQLVNINGDVKSCQFSAFFKDQYLEIEAKKQGTQYLRKTLSLPDNLINERTPESICLTIEGNSKMLYLHWVDLKDVLVNVQNSIFYGQSVIVNRRTEHGESTFKLVFLPASHKEIEIVSAIKVDGCFLNDSNVSTEVIQFARDMGIWNTEDNEPEVFHEHTIALYKTIELQQLLGKSSVVTAHRVVNAHGEYGYAK
ncbi:hypothetical protein [Vibrio sp. 10N.239.312.D08]|uniref:hypothetical protein n=1 Tax=Vibrio sp. 10N.239.312.D08 TaxID=3229978 RepID=UPI0035523B89